MKKNLHEIVCRYIIPNDRKIKKICAPLKDHLNVSGFTFYTINADGSFVFLSTLVDQVDYFYANKLYLDHPFLVHPSKLMSGSLLIAPVQDREEALNIDQRFHLKELFLVQKSNGKKLEGALFANPGNGEGSHEMCTQNIELLHLFIQYFKQEAASLLQAIKQEGYNLKEAKGQKFYAADSSLPLSTQNRPVERFLKDLFSLSQRERECIELYKQGETAQSSAAILGLSQRTVESYFENIKSKLSLSSKAQLLEF